MSEEPKPEAEIIELHPKKECRWSCEYWGADPDSEYCAHPKALEISEFGINLNRMLGAEYMRPGKLPSDKKDAAWGLCKDRQLWVKRSEERMPKGW